MSSVAFPDFIISLFCLVFAILVIVNKNPIVAAFSLLVTFLGFGAIYFRLGSVFITTLQVVVYAGAIAIIFVFVLMLMNLSGPPATTPKRNYNFVIATICLGILFGILALVIFQNTEYLEVDKLPVTAMNKLFEVLFTKYLVPFELSSMLILGALVAAVFITKKDKSIGRDVL